MKKIIKIFIYLIIISVLISSGIMGGFWIKDNEIESIISLSKEDYFNSYIKNDLITKNIFICADLFEIEPELLISLIYYESKFDPIAENINLNKSIDRGLMQLNSFTFKNLPLKQFYDIELNVLTGSKHLKELLIKYNNNSFQALCAYNCGEKRVDNNYIPTKTMDYVNKIKEYQNKLEKDFLIYEKNQIKKGSDI